MPDLSLLLPRRKRGLESFRLAVPVSEGRLLACAKHPSAEQPKEDVTEQVLQFVGCCGLSAEVAASDRWFRHTIASRLLVLPREESLDIHQIICARNTAAQMLEMESAINLWVLSSGFRTMVEVKVDFFYQSPYWSRIVRSVHYHVQDAERPILHTEAFSLSPTPTTRILSDTELLVRILSAHGPQGARR